jgi:hypothetical protein
MRISPDSFFACDKEAGHETTRWSYQWSLKVSAPPPPLLPFIRPCIYPYSGKFSWVQFSRFSRISGYPRKLDPRNKYGRTVYNGHDRPCPRKLNRRNFEDWHVPSSPTACATLRKRLTRTDSTNSDYSKQVIRFYMHKRI